MNLLVCLSFVSFHKDVANIEQELFSPAVTDDTAMAIAQAVKHGKAHSVKGNP